MPNPGTVVGKYMGTVARYGRWEGASGAVTNPPMYRGRWFVSRGDRRRNIIEIAKGDDNRALFSKSTVANWHGSARTERAATRHQPSRAKMAEGEVWEKGLTMQFRSASERSGCWVRGASRGRKGSGSGSTQTDGDVGYRTQDLLESHRSCEENEAAMQTRRYTINQIPILGAIPTGGIFTDIANNIRRPSLSVLM